MTVPGAVLALIRAALPPEVDVYAGRIPTEPPAQYAVFFPDNGTVRALTLCHASDSAIFRWQIKSFAPDLELAVAIADRIRDGILDQRPDVDGWSCGPIGHTFSQQSAHDETIMERPVVAMDDQYRMDANRVSVAA